MGHQLRDLERRHYPQPVARPECCPAPRQAVESTPGLCRADGAPARPALRGPAVTWPGPAAAQGHLASHEGQDFPALLVVAQRFGRLGEVSAAEMCQVRLHSGGTRTDRSAHRVPGANDVGHPYRRPIVPRHRWRAQRDGNAAGEALSWISACLRARRWWSACASSERPVVERLSHSCALGCRAARYALVVPLPWYCDTPAVPGR